MNGLRLISQSSLEQQTENDSLLAAHVHSADHLPPARALATGFQALDAVLPNGGIPYGRLTELQGPMMAGKLTLAQRLIGQTLRAGKRAAFIDLPGMFYPHNLPGERLLVARPGDWKKALRAADMLICSREWGIVVIDLSGHAQAVAPDACSRLARGARETGTIVLLLHDHPMRTLGSLVSLRLKMSRKLTPQGRSLQIWVAKNKLSAPGQTVNIALTKDVGAVPMQWES